MGIFYSTLKWTFFFIFFIVTIAFKPMATAHDGCFYHQVKTPIGF
jgi:hypothetical protein